MREGAIDVAFKNTNIMNLSFESAIDEWSSRKA
jgi:hypothetical protein